MALALLLAAWWWSAYRVLAFEANAAADGSFWKGNLKGALETFEPLSRRGPLDMEAQRGLREAYLMALESPRARESQLNLSYDEVAQRCGRLIGRQIEAAPLRSDSWSGVADFYDVLKTENQHQRVYTLRDLERPPQESLEIEDLLSLRALQLGIDLDRNAVYSLGELGRLAWALGLKQLALGKYREAMTLVPDADRHAFLAEGPVSDEVEQAVVEGMERAAQPPRDADPEVAYRNLGIFLLGQGKFEKARDAFREAQRRSGRSEERWQAYAESQLGHPDEAVALYRSSLTTEPMEAPDRIHVLLSIGQILEDQGRHQEAKEAIRSALDLEPRSRRGLLLMGKINETLGQWWEAEASYVKASQIGTDRVEALADLVSFYRRTNRPTLALAPARRLVELQPDEPLYRKQVDELQEEIEGGTR